MNKTKISVIGVVESTTMSDYYTVLFKDVNSDIKLPINLVSNYIPYIIMLLKNHRPKRPIIYDNFISLLNKSNQSISEIYIYDFINNVFHVYLVINTPDGTINLESNISDAITLSFIYNYDIYISEDILISYTTNVDNLEIQLKKAIDKEDYILAANLRDKINSTKSPI